MIRFKPEVLLEELLERPGGLKVAVEVVVGLAISSKGRKGSAEYDMAVGVVDVHDQGRV